MKYFKYITLVFLSSLLVYCSSGSSSTDDNNSTDDSEEDSSFNVEALLEDVVNSDITPSTNTFLAEVITLNTNIASFSTALDVESLVVAQDQWKKTALAYGDIHVFNIGEVRGKYLNLALYNWPTLPSAIENILAGENDITQDYVSGLSPQIKTLSALEYLLFGEENETLVTNYTNSVKRVNYLKYVASDLETQANRLPEIWGAPTNYGDTFIEDKGTGINGSFNLLYNGLYNLIDTGKVTKIGKPAGLENSSNTDPEITQAFYSNTSLEILRRNILSIKNVYFKTNGLGISDYVYAIAENNTVNNAIDNKITNVIAAIDVIPTNLFDAITDNHDDVTTLHEQLEDLRVLFGVDVQSILSITITSTDNDGD